MSDEESFPIRYLDLAAEASQYAWSGATCKCPTGACPHRQASALTLADRNQLLDALTQAQTHEATAETQRDLAQADADRHLRNARYLGGLLEQFARTLGADPLDFAQLPALVDGLRTTTDQLRIKAADHAHALDRAEAGATLWKTRLVRESTQLRDHLAKARTTTARAEARAGAYCLAYDHLDAVTRTLVTTIEAHVSLTPHTAHHILTTADRQRLLAARDTVRRVLSRDMESYLAQPYDDITPDTRVDLTPAGHAVASQPKAKPCQPGCDIGYHLQGCPHIGTQLGIAPNGGYVAKGGIIREPIPLTMVSEAAATTCRCTWLGIGTPEHPPTSLCLTPEQDQANRQRHHDLTTTVSYAAEYRPAATFQEQRKAYERQQATGASVPPVARESGRLADRGQAVHATDQVLCDVAEEREAQDAKWGEQNHHDGTMRGLLGMAEDARRDCQHAAAQGRLTWSHVLAEEFWEAMSEEDPAKLRAELVQVAAVAVAWAEHIDRRTVEAVEA